MGFITINDDNIYTEDICCANSDKKGDSCSLSKKVWLKERFKEGMVFKKLDARGKVFIEYIPAENAWSPISAKEYMFIDCFWVSGSFKGKGYATGLLNECITDSKLQGKKGIVTLSSKKKMPFLSDPKFLKYKGFQVADTCEPYYELLYLPFDKTAEVPKFKECVKQQAINEKGIVIYYSNHCPYNAKYVPLLEKISQERDVQFSVHKIETKEQAQNAPAPFTTYSVFFDGKFVTNEMFSDNKFIKFLESISIG
jgi:thiol-disulfide isomerase/thioredoxin